MIPEVGIAQLLWIWIGIDIWSCYKICSQKGSLDSETSLSCLVRLSKRDALLLLEKSWMGLSEETNGLAHTYTKVLLYSR
jgi:hypothetical protein